MLPEPNVQKPCPVCGCPEASLLLVSVECASPGCRWHSQVHEDTLTTRARSEVARWQTSRSGEGLGP